MAASLPRLRVALPLLGGRISELLDRDARDRALAAGVRFVVRGRPRAARARAAGPDLLRRLPDDTAARRACRPRRFRKPMPTWAVTWPATLERLTAEAAAATGL